MKKLSEQIEQLEMELEILKSQQAQQEMSDTDKAIAFLKGLDIDVYENNGSVMVAIGENEFFNLEISDAEITYRAWCYDEEVAMNGLKQEK